MTLAPIEGHGYSECTVRLSCLCYSRLSCGLRQVVKILEIINEVFDGIFGEIPCHNTIGNWVKKCGLQSYNESGKTLRDIDHAQIVDESMMIGQEKLLLTIGVPAEHQGRPLQAKDAHVLDIAVAKSWNGENVGKQIKKAAEKAGHSPDYVIGDNASIMAKGISEAKLKHQRDISHSLGMFLERTYKEEVDFKSYTKSMSAVKAKYNMTGVAYLLPPTQRTMARFLNLSTWVKWSSRMQNAYHALSAKEQEIFSFVPLNASLIDELAGVVNCIEKIEHTCKHKGLSEKSVRECQGALKSGLYKGTQRMIKLGECINMFLLEELTVLKNKEIAHNNSSDVIESLFGKYKERKSPNKLHGVTSHILLLPLYTRLQCTEGAKEFDFKTALEQTKMQHLKDWCDENLSPNLVSKRARILQKVA